MSTTLCWSTTSTVKNCFFRSAEGYGHGGGNELEKHFRGAVVWNKIETYMYVCSYLHYVQVHILLVYCLVRVPQSPLDLISRLPAFTCLLRLAFPAGA